jgi:hypothetical protein
MIDNSHKMKKKQRKRETEKVKVRVRTSDVIAERKNRIVVRNHPLMVPCRRCGRDGKLTYANRQKGTYLIYHAKDDRCQNLSSDEYEYCLNGLEQRLGKPIPRSIPIEKIREMKYEKLRLNQ